MTIEEEEESENILFSLINQLSFNLWFNYLNDYDLCLINYWLNNFLTISFKLRLIFICIEYLVFENGSVEEEDDEVEEEEEIR